MRHWSNLSSTTMLLAWTSMVGIAACDKPADVSPVATDAAPSHSPSIAQLAAKPPTADPPADQCGPPSGATWLPKTPPVPLDKPAPHPAPDCPFYRDAWQNFLIATQTAADRRAAFLSYAGVDDVFGSAVATAFAKRVPGKLSLAVRDVKGPNTAQPSRFGPSIGAGVQQAGVHQVVVDQAGHPIYYGIHVNQAFVDFVRGAHLTTAAAVRAADAGIEIPPGVVELKSAWQVVDAVHPPANYIEVTSARVPTLRVVGGQLVADSDHPREVTVALLALHVVFTLSGHPEFIWSTFEHLDRNGVRDVAPAAPSNPNSITSGTIISPQSFTLYKGGTPVSATNQFAPVASFDEATQTFRSGNLPAPTSVYRLYPASKSQTIEEDDEVAQINKAMLSLFPQSVPQDLREHYGLVGAVWLDRPDQTFAADKAFLNDDSDPDIIANGTDSTHSILGGEDRLSSTSMESFTQADQPHCFNCHDTRKVKRDLTAVKILDPKKLNVSHVFSRFADESP
jgi:hypothetical protein